MPFIKLLPAVEEMGVVVARGTQKQKRDKGILNCHHFSSERRKFARFENLKL